MSDNDNKDDARRLQRTIILICIVAAVAAAAIYGMWVLLGWYIAPERPTDRKDHVQVLVVGLGAVGAIITAIIGWRDLKESQRSTETSIENTQTSIENTRLIEEERAQNDALQKYLEQMGELLTKEKLRTSKYDADVRILARSQTLLVLQGLGPARKHILLRFLYESHLINRDESIVSLFGANFTKAGLSGATLIRADLSHADLPSANLSRTDLTFADLRGANLIDADLSGATLIEANLSFADLSSAYLVSAALIEANLSGADLTFTDLSEADLSGAILSEATVSMEQLEACRSLRRATMPDGSRHA